METTIILNKEHENILKVIASVERECTALQSGKEIDSEYFTKAIDFIRNYADKFHHAKEEEILFKEFVSVSEKAHCNPVDQMLHEHDMGREFVKGMETAITSGDKESLIENASSYAALLTDHIHKEDNILYPMTEQVISEETQVEMLAKFKKVKLDEKYVVIIKEFEERK